MRFPQVLAYTYITAKFQLRSSINMRIMERSLYDRLRIERSPKMGLSGHFGGRGEDDWWESTSVFKIARFQTSLVQIRVAAFCMGITICYRRKFGQAWGVPSSPTRSRRKTSRPKGTPLGLRLPHGTRS